MNSDTQHLFERAEQFYRKGVYHACQPLFEQIAREHPDGYPDVQNRLGVIYHLDGKFEEAVRCYEKAVVANPRYTEAAVNLSLAFTDLGRYEEAEDVFHQAADHLEGGDEAAALDVIANRHMSLGDDYVRINRLKDALYEYRHALTLRPLYVDVICKVGTVLRKQGRKDDALLVFDRAKELNPKFPVPYVEAGRIHFDNGFLDLAMAEWQKALELDPSRRDAEALLATVRRALLQQ